MEYFALAISCGSFVFSLTFYPTASQIPHIISLACSSVNFIFPSGKLNKIICKVDHPPESFVPYEEVRILISDEYDRCNLNPKLIHKNIKWHS